MRGWIAAVFGVASLGCSDRLSSGAGDSDPTDASASESASTSESEGSSSSTSAPDLPSDPPEDCRNGVQLLPSCSSDQSGFTCSQPDTAIPICPELSWGPRELELATGLAACGCDAAGALSMRDLDGDSADEILAICGDPEAVFVWQGRADGSLSCATIYPTTSPTALWLIDFDEDGLEDLISVSSSWSGELEMALLRATEPGVFAAAEPLDPLAPGVLAITLEIDLDGDGRTELLSTLLSGGLTYGSVRAWSAAAGELSVELEPFGSLWARGLHRADIDGDGWLDLVATAEQSWWARGSAAGLGAPEPFDGGADHFSIGVGDVDGDEIADLVLGGLPPRYQLGLGDGSFGAQMVGHDSPWPNQSGGEAALVHDLDGDDRAELIINAYSEGWSVWRSSDLGPRFEMQVDLELTMSYAAGDVDGDGRGDLVTASWLSGNTNSQITRWHASR